MSVAGSSQRPVDLVLAHSSHELRGALAAAELCLSSLERRSSQAAELHAWVESLRAQLERAAWAIDDLDGLRGVSRPSIGGPVEMERLFGRRSVAWSRLAAADGKRLSLEWGAGDIRVDCDARRMCQALDNLVSNAIAHGGPRIRIASSRVGDTLRVRIADGAPGYIYLTPRETPLDARHGHGATIARLGIEACGGCIRPAPDGVLVELPLFSPDRPPRPVLSAA